MGELFGGVDSSSPAMFMYCGALEDLGVVDVGDDGLIFAGEVFVEKLDQLVAGERALDVPAVLVAMSSPVFLCEMQEF